MRRLGLSHLKLDLARRQVRALGVEQETDAPVTTVAEMLRARDRYYWHLERGAAREEYP